MRKIPRSTKLVTYVRKRSRLLGGLLAWILKRRAKTRSDKKAVKRIRLKEGQTLTLRVNRSEDWEVK
jgi:hypothetical protein